MLHEVNHRYISFHSLRNKMKLKKLIYNKLIKKITRYISIHLLGSKIKLKRLVRNSLKKIQDLSTDEFTLDQMGTWGWMTMNFDSDIDRTLHSVIKIKQHT